MGSYSDHNKPCKCGHYVPNHHPADKDGNDRKECDVQGCTCKEYAEA